VRDTAGVRGESPHFPQWQGVARGHLSELRRFVVLVARSVPANLAAGQKSFPNMEIGDEALRETCHLVPESATGLREPIVCAAGGAERPSSPQRQKWPFHSTGRSPRM